jgi:hypothetical protein
MDEGLRPRVPRQATWRTLGEFTVRATPGSERRAAEQVARRTRPLSAPPEFVERIKSAITQATLDAMRRDAERQPGAPVSIRILISAATPPQGSEPRHECQGWGFFLISRMSGSRHGDPTSACQIIELFLYPEGLST